MLYMLCAVPGRRDVVWVVIIMVLVTDELRNDICK